VFRLGATPFRPGHVTVGLGVIDSVDASVRGWASAVIPDTPVSLLPPGKIGGGPCVGLYLLDLLHAPARHDKRSVPLRFTLRYLVTAWHEEPSKAHGLLGRLLVAASDDKDMEVELEPLSMEAWRAFGVPPRPAFLLRVPLRVDRPESPARAVIKTVELVHRPMGSLSGLLLGPNGVPIANARMELLGIGAKANTDSKGRFRFDAVPATPQARRLRIFAKGRTMTAAAPARTDPSQPLLIRLNTLEE
jgi:hypothetical protein